LKPIKGVVFDIDGTMYSQTLLRTIIGFELIARLIFFFPSTLKAIKVISSFRKALEEIRKDNKEHGNVSEMQIDMTCKMTGESKEKITAIVDYWIYKKPLGLIPFCKRGGLNDVFTWLKKKEIRIGVFSDYPCHEKCKAMGVYDYIDGFVSSVDNDVNAFKPNKKGFLKIAEKLKLDTENILFIGDRVALDLEGAANVGMQTFLLPKKIFSPSGTHPSSLSLKGARKFIMNNIVKN
jgi:putative hydrolase of the HAD superfamily